MYSKIKSSLRVVVAALCLLTATGASAFDLGGLLGGIAGAVMQGNGQTGNTTTDMIGSAVSGIIGQVTAQNNLPPERLIGRWKYKEPAVEFASQNALANLGGAAGAPVIAKKLVPYYKKFGVNKMQMYVDQDLNFKIKFGKITLEGVIDQLEDGTQVFSFQVFKTIPIGQVFARTRMVNGRLQVTFDVAAVINVLRMANEMVKIQALQNLVALLDMYDGVYIGVTMQRM